LKARRTKLHFPASIGPSTQRRKVSTFQPSIQGTKVLLATGIYPEEDFGTTSRLANRKPPMRSSARLGMTSGLLVNHQVKSSSENSELIYGQSEQLWAARRCL